MRRKKLIGKDLQVHKVILLPGGDIYVRGMRVGHGNLAKGCLIYFSGIKIKRIQDPEASFRYEITEGAWIRRVRFFSGLWLEEFL